MLYSFYFNTRNMMFPVQIFISSNAKLFNKICGTEPFSTKFNLNFTAYLLLLVFKNYQLSFLHIWPSVKFFISRFTYLLGLVVIDLLKWSTSVSSAKFIAWFNSLIYIKNKRGPRTESLGTLYKAEARFEVWPFIETNCFLSDN